MLKLFKFGLWAIVGVGTISVLLYNTNISTPWQYTANATIPAGTQITLTQPNGEPMTMEIPEGQTVSGKKTFDVGAPMALVSFYVLGSIMAFGLKARKRAVPEM